MLDSESCILKDGTSANQGEVTDAISSMTENDQITMLVVQLKKLIEGDCNIV